MLGLAAGNGCEHSSLSFSTSSTSSIENSSPHLGSAVVSTSPFRQLSDTQSSKTGCLESAAKSTGLLPHVTSKRKAPNANTSAVVEAFRVRASSDARTWRNGVGPNMMRNVLCQVEHACPWRWRHMHVKSQEARYYSHNGMMVQDNYRERWSNIMKEETCKSPRPMAVEWGIGCFISFANSTSSS
ncbi:hypothetical protein ZIOFF_047469 [Zingiber officinale]|uniref:Uncharacterized protein n=1 Tax=Zingiber officinale TaxID=94328 RepID=A0A8J5FP72_ZINOF|nr:hypothetical protein ZIOFF_047469 [Zingiber officinale]